MTTLKPWMLGVGLLLSLGPLTGCALLDALCPPVKAHQDYSGTWVGSTGKVTVEGLKPPISILLFAFDGTFSVGSVGMTLKLQQNASSQVTGTVEVGIPGVTKTFDVQGKVNSLDALNLSGVAQFLPGTPSYGVELSATTTSGGNSMTGTWAVYGSGSSGSFTGNPLKQGGFSAKRQ